MLNNLSNINNFFCFKKCKVNKFFRESLVPLIDILNTRFQKEKKSIKLTTFLL